MIEKRFKIILSLVLWMSAIHLVNVILGGQLNYFGIRPGSLESLPYIFTAPWLHGSWMHLINNLIGLAIFSALSLIRGPSFFFQGSLIIITLSGVLVWLFARSAATHIGASGWIFGLWSLAISLAWFQRSFLNIIIAIFVAFFYGSMLWGVLPSNPYISYESHLFGALAGIVAAYTLTRKSNRRPRK